MAEKLYPTEALMDEVSYEVLIQKLKERLDKTDSVLLQRYNFGTKVQQAGQCKVYAGASGEDYCHLGNGGDPYKSFGEQRRCRLGSFFKHKISFDWRKRRGRSANEGGSTRFSRFGEKPTWCTTGYSTSGGSLL
ncbi:AAEL002156-PA [Aedes aegypti]|uniref:AAEL002156-PA n=1 Tax=Aedes aegypti TaxID=7159 RepID=Q17J09_AEDAE|nr:AAEL002156-PA [Aedes aegypti]